MKDADLIQRFLFKHINIRGELVKMGHSFQQALQHHSYPPAVRALLGELSAAATLLSATLKIEGSLTLQVKSDGDIQLLMAECDHLRNFRSIANFENVPQITVASPFSLLGDGQLAITITSKNGKRYQGLVPLVGNSLAQCLESYFEQSEQIKTFLWLQADQNHTIGLLLQELPDNMLVEDKDAWNRITHLASTLTIREAHHIDNQGLIQRLFYEEDVQLFPSVKVNFQCTCSRERTLEAMISLGEDEITTLLQEQGDLEINCQFCNKLYRFDGLELMALFTHHSPDSIH